MTRDWNDYLTHDVNENPKRIYLTREDQFELDPYGLNRLTLNRFKVSKLIPGPLSPIMKIKGSEICDKYVTMTHNTINKQSSAHDEYYNWSLSYLEKFGPQGGIFPLEEVERCYLASYKNALSPKQFNLVLKGRDWLISYITQLTQKIGYPVTYGWKQTVDTNAAIPTGLKKGHFLSETLLMHPGLRHLLPNLPGERYMRKKMRTINQDSICNVRQTEQILSGCRNWLKQYIPEFFGSWLNPADYIQPQATFAVDHNMWSVETDYEHMDEHFSFELTRIVVAPIYEALLANNDASYWYVGNMINEMFYQPIYMGNYMLTGLHCLLSGQNPTNDFETLVQVCQAVGVLLEMNIDPLSVIQFHLGDDMVVLFKTKSHAELFMKLFIEESNRNGLVINEEKSALRHGRIQYCRKFYYPRGKRTTVVTSNGEVYDNVLIGAYPALLSLNSIVNPERQSKSLGINACATYQRLDNAIGSPDWYRLCDLVAKYTTLTEVEISDDDIYNYSLTDWWNRLYGEPWRPEVSPSFCYIHKIKLK